MKNKKQKIGYPIDPIKFFNDEEILKHSNYDFTESDFTGVTKPLSFKCSIHNKEIYVDMATKLRKKFNHCKECKEDKMFKIKNEVISQKIKENKSKVKTKRYNNFLNHENIVIHKSYDFSKSDFKGVNNPITLRCAIHNKDIFLKKAELLKTNKNNKCEECEAEFIEFYQVEGFIVKANRRFNSKFDYSKVEDYSYREPVTIICPIHGEYSQVACGHLRSSCGCPKCGEEYAKSLGGHSRSCYIERTKAETSNLYVIKITGNNEVFYKIGITSFTVEARYTQGYIPEEYSIEVKYMINGLDKGVAYDFEKLLHKKNEQNKYKPLLKFAGYTECFTRVPTDLKDYLDILEEVQ